VSDPVIMAIIGAAATTIQVYIANRNHADQKARTQAVSDKVDRTAKAIDGRMDQLVTASNAQGRQEQRAETRQDERDAAQ
jgi:hypothetical protein